MQDSVDFTLSRGGDGFLLVLVKTGPDSPRDCATNVHVGFVVDAPDEARAKHKELSEGGHHPGPIKSFEATWTAWTAFYRPDRRRHRHRCDVPCLSGAISELTRLRSAAGLQSAGPLGYKRRMSNIIRPAFGAPRPPEPSADSRVEMTTQRVYGEAAGYRVALVRDQGAAEGDVYKVVVGLLIGQEVSTVAILKTTPEGEVDAEIVALAILRTLGLVESHAMGPGVA